MLPTIANWIIEASLPILGSGLVWFIFWIRKLAFNDLPHIQRAVEATQAGVEAIPGIIEEQTNALVNELREHRADIRALTSAIAGK